MVCVPSRCFPLIGLSLAMSALVACTPSDETRQIQAASAQRSALGGLCYPEPVGAVVWLTGDVNGTDLVTRESAIVNDTVSRGSALVSDGFVFSGNGGDPITTHPLDVFATTDFSVEMWVQASPSNGSTATLLYYGADAEALRIYNPSNLGVSIGGNAWQTAALTFDDDTFHHLAVTWRGSDGELRVFLDGVQTHSTNLNPNFVIPGGGILRIGQRQNASASGAFTGVLDEVTVYDRVLTPGEIADISDTGADGKCRRDEDSDTVADERDECDETSSADSSAFEASTGCRASQLDRTLDGVCDQLLPFETTLCVPRCAPVPDGLVGWWPADADAPERELVHGASLELTPSVGRVDGRVGGALSFAATADDDAAVRSFYNFPPSAVAIELWVQIPEDAPSSTIFSYASFSDGAELRVAYFGDQLRFNVHDQLLATGMELDDGAWHHVAFTWRTEDGLGQAYVDGELVAEDNLQPNNLLGAGGVVSVGHARSAATFGASQHFSGVIDDVSL